MHLVAMSQNFNFNELFQLCSGHLLLDFALAR
jgi:hypothetical protein